MLRIVFIFPVLLLVSCGTKTTTDQISSSQWGLFRCLPYNTESLLYLNFDNLKRSDYALEKLTGEKNSPDSWFSKFEEQTNINVDRDASEVIIASAGEGQNIFLIRLKGDFQKVKEHFNKSPVFNHDKVEGKETYTLRQNPSAQMYFPENSILLLSNAKTLFTSLLMSEGKRLNDNGKFISIIRNIKNKQSIWLAQDNGTFAEVVFNGLAGKNSKIISPKILSKINNLSFCADFSNGIQLESAMGCSSAGDAYLLTSAVEGARTMKIISRKDEKLGRIFNKMDVKREGELIRFHVALTENELKDLRSFTEYINQINKF